AGGYVPGNGKIYIVSGYNTGTVDSAQPNTWEYDPVTDTWNDLTATVPFPHPAGGFAFGVINDKLYISGGRDAANADINFTWEFDPAIPAYTAKADMPGGQPNVRGSAVAVGALFAFGGGNPFLAPENVATRTASAAGPAPGSAKAAHRSTEAASALAKTAPARNFDPAAIKRNPLLPTTTARTDVYDPSTDTWTRSADLETIRSFVFGAYISNSDEIIAAGGFDGNFTTAVAEVLTPCIPPPPTPCPSTPTPTPTGCGLTVGSGLTIGFGPNNYFQIALNTVNYTFQVSEPATNEFALFETHDPWGFTVVKDAITGAAHTYTEFTPADLAGFDFSQYRVVILNWDDTFLTDFNAQYTAAIPALEAYINGGGVVWVQAAVQGSPGDVYPMPFGGQGNAADFASSDPVVDPANAMMAGMPNPITGNSASHVSYTGLPGAAHTVVISGNTAQPTLYELFPGGGGCTPTPTPTPTATPSCTPIVVTGSIDAGDPTQNDRLFRSG